MPPADPLLRPATRKKVLHAITYALRFDRRGTSTRRNDALVAQLAAESFADMLEQAGFVLMKKPAAQGAAKAAAAHAKRNDSSRV